MFEAEAEGLRELGKADALRVPHPVCHGTADGHAYLVLEYLRLRPDGDSEQAGRRLAQLHRVTAPRFGWHRDNTIGATPQHNAQTSRWADFWIECRLGYQLRLAAENGFGGRLQSRGERLLGYTEAVVGDHNPTASLLHGDLWGGNLSYDAQGQPVIYDPAVYFGDREADLAMTELFGGFDDAFYGAYRDAWPLAPGYRVRRIFYNLYHVLNHLNIFGGGYLGQAEAMIDRLLSEVA